MDIDIVVIGLNCGSTLRGALESALNVKWDEGAVQVYYSDSGSTDGSLEIAGEYRGVMVIEHDGGTRSAGKARNRGWQAGRGAFVQFLDGDSALDEHWLEGAVGQFKDEGVGAVSGDVRERHPERSFYNWTADQEWNPPVGEIRYFGGNVLMRRTVLEKTGGYLEGIRVAEDPELSYRVTTLGYKIVKVSDKMATHDLGMTTFRAYWKRSFRTGEGYMNLFLLSKGRCYRSEVMRLLVRVGGGLGLLLGGSVYGIYNKNMMFFLFAMLVGFLLIIRPRICWKSSTKYLTLPKKQRKMYAWHCTIVAIPQFLGALASAFSGIFGFFRRRIFVKKGASLLLLVLIMGGLLVSNTGCRRICKGVNCFEALEADACDENGIPNSVFLTKDQKAEITFATEEEISAFSMDIDQDYFIGPGDVLSSIVIGRPDASISNVVVAPDGKIALPRIGIINVNGMTIEQATDVITERYKVYYETPEVTFVIDQYKNNKVFVLGRVSNPGVVYFDGPGTLMEALAISGGLPTIALEAFLTRCMIIRGRSSVLWVDLEKLLNDGNVALNPKLRNGDIIFIPESDDEVAYVMGEVNTPGIIRLKTEMSVLDAIMFSGGPTKDSNLSKIYLIRFKDNVGVVQEINLKDFIANGDLRKNYILMDGDIVYLSTRPIANFNYYISQLSPAVSFINLATDTASQIKNFGNTNTNR